MNRSKIVVWMVDLLLSFNKNIFKQKMPNANVCKMVNRMPEINKFNYMKSIFVLRVNQYYKNFLVCC